MPNAQDRALEETKEKMDAGAGKKFDGCFALKRGLSMYRSC